MTTYIDKNSETAVTPTDQWHMATSCRGRLHHMRGRSGWGQNLGVDGQILALITTKKTLQKQNIGNGYAATSLYGQAAGWQPPCDKSNNGVNYTSYYDSNAIVYFGGHNA